MKSVEVSCKVNLLMKRLSKGVIPIMNDKIKGCGSSYGGDAVAYVNSLLTPEEREEMQLGVQLMKELTATRKEKNLTQKQLGELHAFPSKLLYCLTKLELAFYFSYGKDIFCDRKKALHRQYLTKYPPPIKGLWLCYLAMPRCCVRPVRSWLKPRPRELLY